MIFFGQCVIVTLDLILTSVVLKADRRIIIDVRVDLHLRCVAEQTYGGQPHDHIGLEAYNFAQHNNE